MKTINEKIKDIIRKERDLDKAVIKVWNAKLTFLSKTKLVDIIKPLDIGLFGHINCPYCKEYVNCCFGCPIKAYTKKSYCYDTPYDKISEFLYDLRCYDFEKFDESKRLELIKLVKEEIKFLKKVIENKTI